MLCYDVVDVYTYANKQHWNRGHDGERKEQRDNLGGVLGVVAEDVMDLGLLAVSQGRLVGRLGGNILKVEVDVEDGGEGTSGRAEGA